MPELNETIAAAKRSYEEYAYVITDQGARWKKVSNNNSLETDEEQRTLFSINISEDDGRRRKIFAGVIPTGRREAYIAAGKFTEESTANTNDPNAAEDPNKPLDSRIYSNAFATARPLAESSSNRSHAQKAFLFGLIQKRQENHRKCTAARADVIKNSREQIQTISWLILLDFPVPFEKK